ncbi:hypothetical protein ACWD7C_29415 [Streptomyces sp. NPDC005134]|uniref:hypothetical protein n=1 Tax=Streptomyces sp. NPDC005098 TaxID=3154560 RepID=UPI0033BEC2D1
MWASPCTFINTATVSGGGSESATASNPTTVTGGTCNGGNGDGASILPTNLNGILTMFNNVSTSNNINRLGRSNTINQTFTKTTE